MKTLRLAVRVAAAAALLVTLLPAQQTWTQAQNQVGATSSMLSGSAVSGVGDLDGDGSADYVVGAWGDDAAFPNAGSFTLYSGDSGNELGTVLGASLAGKLGWRVVALGTHGDATPKFAVSAPFHTEGASQFVGFVGVYVYTGGQLQPWSPGGTDFTVLGQTPGAMVGGGLAAFDADNDGDLDLAISSLGAGATDGRVEIWRLSAAGLQAPQPVTLDGAAGSAELFGFSLADAGNVLAGNAHELLVGAPLADDTAVDAGAASVWLVSQLPATSTALANPAAAAQGAHFGWSVAGGQDLDGDGSDDLVVGAPDDAEGKISVYSGAAGFPNLEVHFGEATGDRFGYAVAIAGDGNFDGFADYAIGAPNFNNDFGKVYVRSLRPGPTELFSAETPAGDRSLFGFSLGFGGDIDQDGKDELLVGGPAVSNARGFIMAYRPPVDPPDPPAMSTSGNYEWETDVIVTVTGLDTSAFPGELWWYIGDQQGTTVTPQGYTIDIGGNLEIIGPIVNDGSGTAELVYHIEDSRAEGSLVAFQLVEDRGQGFVRVSQAKGNFVVNPGYMLFVEDKRADLDPFQLPLSQQFTLETRYGLPNSPVFFYWGNSGLAASNTVLAPNASTQDPFYLNLINPQDLGFALSDATGVATLTLTPFPTWNTGIIRFQAFDWDVFPVNRALSPDARGQFVP